MRNLNFRKPVIILTCCGAVSMALLTAASVRALYQQGIGSSRYAAITQQRALLADLAGPLSLAAQRGITLQLLAEKDPLRLAALVSAAADLRNATENRCAQWKDRIDRAPLREQFEQTVCAAAREYLDARETELLPLLMAGTPASGADLERFRLQPLYEKYTAASRSLSAAVETDIISAEQAARTARRRSVAELGVLAVLLCAGCALVAAYLFRSIRRSLQAAQDTLAAVADGSPLPAVIADGVTELQELHALARTIAAMHQSLSDRLQRITVFAAEHSTVLHELAAGRLAAVRGNETTGDELFDRIGIETNTLIAGLRQALDTARQAIAGSAAAAVPVRSEQDEWGKTLAALVTGTRLAAAEFQAQQTTLLHHVSAYALALRRLAAGDLSVDVRGATGVEALDQLAATITSLGAAVRALSDRVAMLSADGDAVPAEATDGLAAVALPAFQAVATLRQQREDARAAAATMAATVTRCGATLLQVAKTSAQVAAAVSEFSRQAQSAAAETQAAGVAGAQGAALVQTVNEKIQMIRQREETAVAALQSVTVRAASISERIGAVTKIADHTNLVSLNAAIEAARAGEAGRGFAVVADEVRQLADDAAAAAQAMNGSVAAVQEQAKASAQAVDGARQDSEESVRLSADAQRTVAAATAQTVAAARQMEALAAALAAVAAPMKAMAATAEQQAAASSAAAAAAPSDRTAE
jgi:methyl-accepting chemotaxis protein